MEKQEKKKIKERTIILAIKNSAGETVQPEEAEKFDSPLHPKQAEQSSQSDEK